VLGDNAWRESGLGAPTDIAALQQRIISLDQWLAGRTMQLAARDDDLDAARTANRALGGWPSSLRDCLPAVVGVNVVRPRARTADAAVAGVDQKPSWA